MLKLNVGLNRKMGEPNFGSRGGSVNLKVELDNSLMDTPDRLREKISRKAAEKGDVIIALQQEENSLENIFKTVTGHVGRI